MQYIYHTLTIFCLLITLLSSLRLARWWVKTWDVVRAQIVVTMMLLFVIGLLWLPLTEWWAMVYLALLLIGSFYHFYIIHPFTPLHKVELQKTQNKSAALRIMTSNVRQKNKEYNRLIALVGKENPDILLLTEVDHGWVESVLHLKKQYPYTILQPQENTYGIAIFSKYKLKETDVKFLIEDDVPCIHTKINFNGKDVQFFGMHPRPPAPWNTSEHKDLELIKVAGMSNEDNLPTIVSGDLNDVGWSRITKTFKNISGLLDPRIGRGFYSTYNALIPGARMPVDHFFVSKHFKLLKISRLEKIGSDHFPVMIDVNLENPEQIAI